MKSRVAVLVMPLFFMAALAIPPGRAVAQGPITGRLPREKVSTSLRDHVETARQAGFLVLLREQADLSGAAFQPTREARRRFVYDALRKTAARSQAPLRRLLDAAGVHYESFYLVNMLHVIGEPELVGILAARPDVAYVESNAEVRGVAPQVQGGSAGATPERSLLRIDLDAAAGPTISPGERRSALPFDLVRGWGMRSASGKVGIEWNVAKIGAPAVWALGVTGQGTVIAGQDTGYQWDHPALKSAYRGWSGVKADHNYNWHDAIHSAIAGTTNPCGYNTAAPCDDYGHGTHTMGSMVGDDGAGRQIGVAPGAKWIGCRNMDQGVGRPSTYIECFEFFLAPYPLDMDPAAAGDPAKAPDVINNSWSCPPDEQCQWYSLQAAVEAVRAAGILVTVSAGNSGPGCGSVGEPPSIYEASFSVGATDSGDQIASFSSRGPVSIDESGRMKPEITAPGASVESSTPGNNYGMMSGTSMAAPHVAGGVALLLSAVPELAGDVDTSELILQNTSMPITTTQTCGNVPGTQVPNNTYGWGRLDALAAVVAARNPCPVGDLDANRRIDAVDLQLMARHWQESQPGSGTPDYYDINGDGRVDILDVQMVGTGWEERCAQ